MQRFVHALLQAVARPRRQPNGETRRVRPEVEALEDRLVPAVTYHGGAVLPHVEVQAVFYGSTWQHGPYRGQARRLDGFLNTVVQSSYLDQLTEAGYCVGRGSWSPGRFLAAGQTSGQVVTDGQLEQSLQAGIRAHTLRQPDPNRLYVIFVQPNQVVDDGGGGNSRNDFYGYHGAFLGRDAHGHRADIRYAVIAYPGGSAGNGPYPGLPTLGGLTVTASHEVAEAATDPDMDYKVAGWYDDTARVDPSGPGAEIGEAAGDRFAYLDGYAVQLLADKADRFLVPPGSAVAPATVPGAEGSGAFRAHAASVNAPHAGVAEHAWSTIGRHAASTRSAAHAAALHAVDALFADAVSGQLWDGGPGSA